MRAPRLLSHPARAGRLRWIAPVLVLALATAARFWALGRPDTLVFDELFYVRDAISQLAHGYPTTWPDSEPSLAGDRAVAFSGEASNAVHPPLGKWLIGLGILLFGPGTGWGWRSAVALAGVATVGITMRLAWRISRSLVVACLAGLLLAVDGVHVTLTRVALLDGFLACLIALGALFVWRDHERAVSDSTSLVRGIPAGRLRGFPSLRRPWLLAAGLAFGAATAVKWSGVYPLVFFLLFVTVRDLVLSRQVARASVSGQPDRIWPLGMLHALPRALTVAAATSAVAATSYVLSWLGWILTAGGWARDTGDSWWASLWSYHLDMLGWHGALSAPHPFQAHPLTWPFALVPTAMYREPVAGGCGGEGDCVAVISSLPNPLITWGGVAALLALGWIAARSWRLAARGRFVSRPEVAVAAAFVLTGYLSGWLPWVLTFSRSAVFQFYTVVLTPFSALALALALGVLCADRPAPSGVRLDPSESALKERRIATTVFICVTVALSAFFFPLWSAEPVPEWFWRLHLWLPAWT